MSAERLTAIYHIRDTADRVEARAQGIAVEQSVEMPIAAITDQGVLDDIVGQVESIRDLGDGSFEARIGLSVATTGLEAGQLVNMLFGNSSMHPDITLADAEFPDSVLKAFGGPNLGLDGLRKLVGAGNRALTCSALKPQGLPPDGLAKIAAQMAEGGLDFIKDDHGIADQYYSPFAQRVPRIAQAVAATGNKTVYLPSLSGHLEQMRAQIKIARDAGVKGVLVAPMIAGVSTFHALVRENPGFAFMGHPALTGPGYIAPPFLFGKLFRLFGADASVFANHGGRFGYSPATCTALAQTALSPFGGLKPTVPVPAGGMTLARVSEMLQFYGPDVMLLIGGDLLSAGAGMAGEAAKFQDAVVREAA
jgi:ribulose-bisphosphate carboxylase large chain